MSRTYRRTKQRFRRRRWDSLEWRLKDSGYTLEEALLKDDVIEIKLCAWGSSYRTAYDVYYSKTSKTGKAIVARWHSDAGTTRFKEPGPMWFVREFTQVPYRNRAKQEIHKFLRNEEYEVIIESKPHLDYWT